MSPKLLGITFIYLLYFTFLKEKCIHNIFIIILQQILGDKLLLVM